MDTAGFFKSHEGEQEVNLPLMQKIKMIDTLADDEQKALFKMIDLALANKRMKDNSISVLSCQKHFTANFLSFPSRKLVIAYPDIDSAAAGFRFEITIPT